MDSSENSRCTGNSHDWYRWAAGSDSSTRDWEVTKAAKIALCPPHVCAWLALNGQQHFCSVLVSMYIMSLALLVRFSSMFILHFFFSFVSTAVICAVPRAYFMNGHLLYNTKIYYTFKTIAVSCIHMKRVSFSLNLSHTKLQEFSHR